MQRSKFKVAGCAANTIDCINMGIFHRVKTKLKCDSLAHCNGLVSVVSLCLAVFHFVLAQGLVVGLQNVNTFEHNISLNTENDDRYIRVFFFKYVVN